VLAICDKGWALQAVAGAQAHLGGDFVTDETDHPCRGEQPQMRERTRMDEALNSLHERDHGADEDRQYDAEARKPLAAQAAEEEGEAEWDSTSIGGSGDDQCFPRCEVGLRRARLNG